MSDMYFTPTSLMNECLKRARSTCPVDTSNMKNNGIYAYRRGRANFSIVWDKTFAYYMEIVDKELYKHKSAKTAMNKGFVAKAFAYVSGFLYSVKDLNYRAIRYSSKLGVKSARPHNQIANLNAPYYDNFQSIEDTMMITQSNEKMTRQEKMIRRFYKSIEKVNPEMKKLGKYIIWGENDDYLKPILKIDDDGEYYDGGE